MNEFAKTGAFLAVAALLVVVAQLARPGEVRLATFDDQGTEFYKDFTDARQAAELEVWEFDKDRGCAVPFNCRQNDKGLWTIPSHWDYPADGKTRMARAAALLLGLKRDKYVSDEVDRQKLVNLIDPKAEGLELDGRGRRVTFKDQKGNVLADLVIGKEVEGKAGFRYVRRPDSKRIYQAKIDADVSTKFADWIEADLLKSSSWDTAQITFDNYKVDEQARAIVPGDKLVVSKDDASKWTMPGLGTSEEIDETKVNDIASTITQLKIVGVRKKPEGLSEALETVASQSPQNQEMLAMLLQQRGYFLGPKNKVFSKQGDVLLANKKGVLYTLRFGEIVPGEGDAVTSGKEDAKPKPGKTGETGPPPVAQNNRYLMVTVQFDESLLKKPSKVRLADDVLEKRKQAKEQIAALQKAIDAYKDKHDKKPPETLAKLTEGDNAPLKELKKDPWDQDYVLELNGDAVVIASLGEDKATGGEGAATDIRSDKLAAEDELRAAADEWKAYDKKVEDGKKEVASLQKRFGPWYYVIDQASFAKLKPAHKDLVKEKAATPPADAAHKPGESPLPGGQGK